MGMSTDAMFFFGFSLDQDEDWGSLRERYAEKLGIDEWGAEMDSQPVQIDFHCDVDYPIYFIYAHESYKRAWRGKPKEVSAMELLPNFKHWTDEIRAFCELMDIPFEEPKFYIASVLS